MDRIRPAYNDFSFLGNLRERSVPPFNRRTFGKLIAGAAALPALTAARKIPATDDKTGGTAPAAPLTAEQMEQYRKTLPDRSKELDKLHSFHLGYGYEPDFIFRAVSPNQSRRPRRASTKTAGQPKVKHG